MDGRLNKIRKFINDFATSDVDCNSVDLDYFLPDEVICLENCITLFEKILRPYCPAGVSISLCLPLTYSEIIDFSVDEESIVIDRFSVPSILLYRQDIFSALIGQTLILNSTEILNGRFSAYSTIIQLIQDSDYVVRFLYICKS